MLVTSGEDLSGEEHVDNEFLWNLKLLSEVCMSSDGQTPVLFLSSCSDVTF